MTYTLNSGIKCTIPLSSKQIEKWKKCYENDVKFIVNIGNEIFGLNPVLVADWRVHNKNSEYRSQIVSIIKETENTELSKAYAKAQVLVKVICKCGTTYTTETTKRRAWFCSKCKQEVLLINDELCDTNKGKAYIMSNKLEMLK